MGGLKEKKTIHTLFIRLNGRDIYREKKRERNENENEKREKKLKLYIYLASVLNNV